MAARCAPHRTTARDSDAFHASANDTRTSPVPTADISRTSACYRGPFTCAIRPSRRDACTHMGVRRISCTSPARCADDFYTNTSDRHTNPITAAAIPIPSPPPPAQAYPPALRFMQADTPAAIPTFVPQHPVPLVPAPHNISPPSVLTLVTPAPSQFPLPSIHAFPPVPESPQPTQTNPITATLDVLAEVIATLKTSLEVILSAQQSAESHALEPEAVQS